MSSPNNNNNNNNNNNTTKDTTKLSPSNISLISKKTLRKVPFAILASEQNVTKNQEVTTTTAPIDATGITATTTSSLGTKGNVSSKKRKRPSSNSNTRSNVLTNTEDYFGEGGRTGQTDERLKSIGKKTRQRLNEELSKRKEIVRLDDDAILKQHTKEKQKGKLKQSSFGRATAASTTSKRSTTTRKRKKAILRNKSESYNNDDDGDGNYGSKQNIDTWFPCTRKLKSTDDIPKGEKSNIVQLHGLPIGIKVEHIRKFFTGLSPQRIFMIPSLKNSSNRYIRIEELDASHDEEEHEMNDVYVERYHPAKLRVFVKFQSYLVADIAITRSGELIRLMVDDDSTNNRPTTTATAIAITPVSKHVASHIQRYLSIDGVKGEEMHDTIQKIESQIPKIINELLWVITKKELKLKFEITSIGGQKHDDDNLNSSSVGESSSITTPIIIYPKIDDLNDLLYNIYPAMTKQRQQKLGELYNQLLGIYEMMEQTCSAFMMQDFNPCLSNVPTHRLICTVSTWILDQLDTIKKCIDAFKVHRISPL